MNASITRRRLLAASLGAPAALAQPRRRNVLFIAIDDLNTRLGCYGWDVQSPNIDALARAGVRFDRAYCQYPLCNPSRSSLLTGRRPPTTRVMENSTWFRDTLPDVVTLPQHFRENGYWTGRVGKIFHGGLDDDKGWVEGSEPLRRQPPRTPAENAARIKNADRWEEVAGDGESQADYRTATRAIEMMKAHAAEPFFLACGFLKPHVPLVAPAKDFARYDAKRLELPADFTPNVACPPPACRPNFDLFNGREAPADLAREGLRAYYAAVSFTDTQVGRVLRALDELKLRDNTVIVLFGDHGWHLGEKGMWSKMSLFEVSTRAPLMVAAPGMKGNGKVSTRPVEFVDIYPTLADLCGLPAPKGVEGRSLKPLLGNPESAWDKPAYTFIRRGKTVGATVRTERYRYTEWDGGAAGRELYDERADPGENRNLAGAPEHKATVETMRKLLHAVPQPAS